MLEACEHHLRFRGSNRPVHGIAQFVESSDHICDPFGTRVGVLDVDSV